MSGAITVQLKDKLNENDTGVGNVVKHLGNVVDFLESSGIYQQGEVHINKNNVNIIDTLDILLEEKRLSNVIVDKINVATENARVEMKEIKDNIIVDMVKDLIEISEYIKPLGLTCRPQGVDHNNGIGIYVNVDCILNTNNSNVNVKNNYLRIYRCLSGEGEKPTVSIMQHIKTTGGYIYTDEIITASIEDASDYTIPKDINIYALYEKWDEIKKAMLEDIIVVARHINKSKIEKAENEAKEVLDEFSLLKNYI